LHSFEQFEVLDCIQRVVPIAFEYLNHGQLFRHKPFTFGYEAPRFWEECQCLGQTQAH